MCVAAGEKKKPHIKKPLNAFMLYMKEMRAKVVAECTLKESAAINQILGRRVSEPFPIFLHCRGARDSAGWAGRDGLNGPNGPNVRGAGRVRYADVN